MKYVYPTHAIYVRITRCTYASHSEQKLILPHMMLNPGSNYWLNVRFVRIGPKKWPRESLWKGEHWLSLFTIPSKSRDTWSLSLQQNRRGGNDLFQEEKKEFIEKNMSSPFRKCKACLNRFMNGWVITVWSANVVFIWEKQLVLVIRNFRSIRLRMWLEWLVSVAQRIGSDWFPALHLPRGTHNQVISNSNKMKWNCQGNMKFSNQALLEKVDQMSKEQSSALRSESENQMWNLTTLSVCPIGWFTGCQESEIDSMACHAFQASTAIMSKWPSHGNHYIVGMSCINWCGLR